MPEREASGLRASGGQFRSIRSMELAMADDDPQQAPLATDTIEPRATPQNPGTDEAEPDLASIADETGSTIVAHVTVSEVVAYQSPDAGSDEVERFVNPTDYGGPLVFQAVGPPTDDGWIEVLLPIRPNGITGWVEVADVELTINPYRIDIDASGYGLTVFRNDEPILTATVAIGTGNTPTPLGRFYLIALIRPRNQFGPYGTYAYGISGYSETLESFRGGEGGIGIHGTNRPDLLGQDVSNGCVRVANATIEDMASFLPLGTPVHIFRTDGRDA